MRGTALSLRPLCGQVERCGGLNSPARRTDWLINSNQGASTLSSSTWNLRLWCGMWHQKLRAKEWLPFSGAPEKENIVDWGERRIEPLVRRTDGMTWLRFYIFVFLLNNHQPTTNVAVGVEQEADLFSIQSDFAYHLSIWRGKKLEIVFFGLFTTQTPLPPKMLDQPIVGVRGNAAWYYDFANHSNVTKYIKMGFPYRAPIALPCRMIVLGVNVLEWGLNYYCKTRSTAFLL